MAFCGQPEAARTWPDPINPTHLTKCPVQLFWLGTPSVPTPGTHDGPQSTQTRHHGEKRGDRALCSTYVYLNVLSTVSFPHPVRMQCTLTHWLLSRRCTPHPSIPPSLAHPPSSLLAPRPVHSPNPHFNQSTSQTEVVVVAKSASTHTPRPCPPHAYALLLLGPLSLSWLLVSGLHWTGRLDWPLSVLRSLPDPRLRRPSLFFLELAASSVRSLFLFLLSCPHPSFFSSSPHRHTRRSRQSLPLFLSPTPFPFHSHSLE